VKISVYNLKAKLFTHCLIASSVYLVRMEAGDPSARFPKKPGQAGQGFVAARKMVLAR